MAQHAVCINTASFIDLFREVKELVQSKSSPKVHPFSKILIPMQTNRWGSPRLSVFKVLDILIRAYEKHRTLDTGPFSSRPDMGIFSDMAMWIEILTSGNAHWLLRLFQGPCVRQLWKSLSGSCVSKLLFVYLLPCTTPCGLPGLQAFLNL